MTRRLRSRLARCVAPLAERLAEQEPTIVEELNSVQGSPVDIGGYYLPDADKLAASMRPSATLNEALALLDEWWVGGRVQRSR